MPMPEAAVKAYSKEAERLFQRGVAAARGGQRRIAAGLLTRAVQLNPGHEAAWLWLSGVLDDPHDVAFCLRAALRINPDNQRTLRALRWLEDRKLQTPPATESSVVRSIDLNPPPAPDDPQEATTWWVQFRESLRAEAMMRFAKVMGVAALYAIVILTAVVYRKVEARPPIIVPEIVTGAVQQAPQQRLVEAPEVARSQLLGYLSQIQAVRRELNQAQEEYHRAAQSGGTAVAQMTAVRAYRERLNLASARLLEIAPPTVLQEAHQAYLEGLELEQTALDDLLQFYSEYNVALANRAALRLQEANSRLSQARAIWDTYSSEIAAQSSPPPFFAR